MDRVARELEAVVAEGLAPSASIAVRVEGTEVLHHTVGRARLDPLREARPDEPYDLASLTKPVAATVAAGMVEAGQLALDQPIARFVPDVDPRITLRHLLDHTAGYPAWARLSDGHRAEILVRARTTPLVSEPGAAHVYSDLGFITLLHLLETVGEARLDALLEPWLARIGADLRWGWPGAAATEDCPHRGRIVEGEVHDLNARALGGVSAHAGLFGTARAVATFGEAALDRRLPRVWDGAGAHRGGWDTPGPSAGRAWPADGRGHLGYTGTSLWLAPAERVVVALLTNRVHPVDGDKAGIRAARQRVHDAVAITLGWDTGRR